MYAYMRPLHQAYNQNDVRGEGMKETKRQSQNGFRQTLIHQSRLTFDTALERLLRMRVRSAYSR